MGQDMKDVSFADLKKGAFMIASPDFESGIFHRSVVLLCDHSAQGSFGLIVNKPLEVEGEEGVLQMENGERQFEMRASGPNEPSQIMLLQSQSVDEEVSLEICPGIYLNGDLGILQDEEDEIPQTILCFGYGGWVAGALEQELLAGAWFLRPAKKEHIFDLPPERLWQTLLRELGGSYKTLSLMPENLELN